MRPGPVDPATVARARARRHAWLRAIAAFKLVKGVVLLAAAFVPLEAWALVHHPTLTRSLVLALNLAIVGCLVHALRSEAAGHPSPGPLTKEERG